MVLLSIFFIESGVDHRRKAMQFFQASVVYEITPPIEGTVLRQNSPPGQQKVHQLETATLNSRNKYQNKDLNFSVEKQNLDTQSYNKISSSIETLEDKNESSIARPTPSFSKPIQKTDFKVIEPPNHAKKSVSNLAATKVVQYRKIMIPSPKPQITVDLHKRNRVGREQLDPSGRSMLKHALTNESRHDNDKTTAVPTGATLKFNNELLAGFQLPKNAQFSAKKMSNRGYNESVFKSVQPKFQSFQGKQQCKLVPRHTKKSELNIQKIQREIEARHITISNILAHRPVRNPKGISISGLLASGHNTPSHNQRRASENIGFLLTNNRLKNYAGDFVCEPY